MKTVTLPVEARDPKKLARRLSPEPAGGLYLLRVCRGLQCDTCVFHEPPEIVISKKVVEDPLSGLRLRLPVVEARYCGRTIWRAEWRKGRLRVEWVECPYKLASEACHTSQEGCLPRDRALEVLSRECGR